LQRIDAQGEESDSTLMPHHRRVNGHGASENPVVGIIFEHVQPAFRSDDRREVGDEDGHMGEFLRVPGELAAEHFQEFVENGPGQQQPIRSVVDAPQRRLTLTPREDEP